MPNSRAVRVPAADAPSKRVQQKAATRRRLLDSAYGLFEERQYSAVSVEDVASSAGISRVGFYLHFAGMLDLAKELMEPARHDILEHYRALDHLVTSEENLRRWSTDIIELWRLHAVRIGLLGAVLSSEADADSLWTANLTTLRELMPAYISRFDPGPARELASWRIVALALAHERLCHFLVVTDVQIDHEVLVHLLTEGCASLLDAKP